MRFFKKIEGKKGIALIMALWIMTILLVVATSFAFMMRTEVKMAGNYRNGVKAHYLALAGVEHAIAVLLADTGNTDHYGEAWHTTFRTNWNETAVTWDALPISCGDGTYAVHLSDENSKCDLSWSNASGLYYLMTPHKLSPYTETTWADYCRKVCNVADYADAGSDPLTYPATSYTGYDSTGCKDTPFDTLREIQKVTGINLSSTGYTSTGYDNPLDTVKTALWERGDDTDITVYAQDYNTPVDGGSRIDLNSSEAELEAAIGSLLDTGDCAELANDTYSDYNYPWGTEDVYSKGGIGAAVTATAANTAAIDEQEMIDIADKITVGDYYNDSNIIKGTININTGTFYGLRSILDIDRVKADHIIAVRSGTEPATDPKAGQYLREIHGVADDYFEHRGEIMYVWGIDRATFQEFADIITVRSDRFRIYSTGRVTDAAGNTVAARKIEAVVDRHYHDAPIHTPGPIKILYWSERVFED